MMAAGRLRGERFELSPSDAAFPEALRLIPQPPKMLYVIGNLEALRPGLAVIGARKATPYGCGCARRFSRLAAEKGVCIISGGARGCDSEAHRAALDASGDTVAFLGGGCDRVYPPEHFGLFQEIIDAGGAIASEYPWNCKPLPYMFRTRNRLIAGLADAVLIVEAGLPSGTFSTADEALSAGKDVLVVPGAITSESSHGANRLLHQGASPVIDDETFEDALFAATGMLKRPPAKGHGESSDGDDAAQHDPLVAAILAAPLGMDALYELACSAYGERDARMKMMETLAEAEATGIIARQADGRYSPVVRP